MLSSSTSKQTPLFFANHVVKLDNSFHWVGSFDDTKCSCYSVANLSQAYSDTTTSVWRGFAVEYGFVTKTGAKSSQVLVRDEIRSINPVDIASS